MPLNVTEYERLLKLARYDEMKTKFLVEGFSRGFDIGYQGPQQRTYISRNIPLTVGSKQIMWDKIIKEVAESRYAGPFERPPFDRFVQSPIGLVPKAGGKTRLIFHLSYDFSPGFEFINHFTPKEICTVKYKDLDFAVNQSLELIDGKMDNFRQSERLWYGKTDLQSAFRLLPIRPSNWWLLIMKAENPKNGRTYYFVDKCLPFGASISCSHFQRFSDSIAHIRQYLTNVENIKIYPAVTNYLDDFLFVARTEETCNLLLRGFLEMCKTLNVAVAADKTEWANTQVIFFGILIDGEIWVLSVPQDKRIKAIHSLRVFVDKKKVTVKQLQSLAGLLNF